MILHFSAMCAVAFASLWLFLICVSFGSFLRPPLHPGFQIYRKSALEDAYFSRFMNRYVPGSTRHFVGDNHETAIAAVHDHCTNFTALKGEDGLITWATEHK